MYECLIIKLQYSGTWYMSECRCVYERLRISSCFSGPLSEWFRHCHISLKKPHEMSAAAISISAIKLSRVPSSHLPVSSSLSAFVSNHPSSHHSPSKPCFLQMCHIILPFYPLSCSLHLIFFFLHLILPVLLQTALLLGYW